MKRFARFLVLMITLISGVLHSTAQNPDSSLNVLATQFPQEKIYIHYDKDYYVAGETIWFKAYLYSDNKPSNLSSNFYLQFTDDKGRLISSKKLPLLGAVAKGNIDIPDTLPQGNYYIRALTPYMLNFDEDFIYKKNVFIFRSGSTSPTGTVEPRNISLQFFPESGHLVDGLLSSVAFKAVDQWGIPVMVNGAIKTEEGTTVAPFKSYHDGMGKVQFKPQAGKKYSAEIEVNGGMRGYPLPPVQPSGINLKIQDEKGGKLFQLSRSEKNKELFGTLRLLVQMNNRIVYDNEIEFEDYPSVKGHLITDSLPSGILHFTVFNENGMPLAERLAFVNNGEYISPASISVVQQGLDKKAKNELEIIFPEGIQRSASVSVTDASGTTGSSGLDNIWSSFLLTGDLKGYVHNPAWYFQPQTDSIKMALDNLMLTHGWSRFSWIKILSNEFPVKKINDGNLISLSGVVKENKDKEPYTGGKLNFYLEAEDSTSQAYLANVDANGRFTLDSIFFRGKAKLFYAYTNSQDKPRASIMIPDQNITGMSVEMIPADIFKSGKQLSVIPGNEELRHRTEFIKSGQYDIKELQRVTVRTNTNRKPIDEVNEKYTTGVFRAMGKENLDVINDPSNDKSMNVVDYIKNRIQTLELQGNRFVNRKNFSLMTGAKWFVQAFLNESPVDVSLLRTLRMDKIALVKFYEAGFVGVSSGAPGGAVVVYTKDQSEEEPKIDKLEYVKLNGYSVIKEFYNPDYSVAAVKPDFIDNRTTLYWNPDVYTDMETKKVKLNFYNNDISKKFRVVVEGFDAAGKLIRVEKLVE